MILGQAILEFMQGQRKATSLPRLYMQQQWLVPVPLDETQRINETGMPHFDFRMDSEKKVFLNIFSDRSLFINFHQMYPFMSDQFLTLEGNWLFKFFASAEFLDYVVIDPESPHSFFYQREQIMALEKHAEAFELEQSIRKIQYKNDMSGLEILRQHDAYYVIFDNLAGSNFLVLFPNEAQRLVSVFTTYDYAQQASEKIEIQKGYSRQIMGYKGRDLFLLVKDCKGADGLVFNPYLEEIEGIGFSKKFAEVVLAMN